MGHFPYYSVWTILQIFRLRRNRHHFSDVPIVWLQRFGIDVVCPADLTPLVKNKLLWFHRDGTEHHTAATECTSLVKNRAIAAGCFDMPEFVRHVEYAKVDLFLWDKWSLLNQQHFETPVGQRCGCYSTAWSRSDYAGIVDVRQDLTMILERQFTGGNDVAPEFGGQLSNHCLLYTS